ncbi:hypothetical protein BDN72DRAFT_637230 [Pluteus cervinus]|uniref:Uncharacterized protein n=1 Tax=Pluteus cervinus TaxID=181527 RepID=A0ACD3BA42_9AGAR|nr:hypothetical protein BDN72DRAFT_637230 [Pluteus cervinus]
MSIAPFSLDVLREIAATSVTINRHAAVAAYSLHVYDYCISFSDEYLYIHQARWTSIKVAYMICRYLPLFFFPVYLWAWLGDHSPTLCESIIHPLYGLMVIFPLSAQAVVLIRSFAFTGRNRYILTLFLLCYIALVVAEIWLFGFQFVFVDELFQLLGESGCYANDAHAEGGGAFAYLSAYPAAMIMLSAFLFDFVMMSVVVVHCLRIRGVGGRLGKMFLAQGFTAFILLSALNLVTACFYFGTSRQYDGLGLPMFLILPDVVACKLILMLRRRVSPTTTRQDRLHSILVRKAFDNLQLEEDFMADDHRDHNIDHEESQNRPIEQWD